jgi:hypothetical protein
MKSRWCGKGAIMDSNKSRKFVFTGIINDDTKIFGTTYGEFKRILEKGFAKKFAQIGPMREMTPVSSLDECPAANRSENGGS